MGLSSLAFSLFVRPSMSFTDSGSWGICETTSLRVMLKSHLLLPSCFFHASM